MLPDKMQSLTFLLSSGPADGFPHCVQSLTGNSAGLASGGYLSADPNRGITKDSVFPDPVADCMIASLLLFRTL